MAGEEREGLPAASEEEVGSAAIKDASRELLDVLRDVAHLLAVRAGVVAGARLVHRSHVRGLLLDRSSGRVERFGHDWFGLTVGGNEGYGE